MISGARCLVCFAARLSVAASDTAALHAAGARAGAAPSIRRGAASWRSLPRKRRLGRQRLRAAALHGAAGRATWRAARACACAASSAPVDGAYCSTQHLLRARAVRLDLLGRHQAHHLCQPAPNPVLELVPRHAAALSLRDGRRSRRAASCRCGARSRRSAHYAEPERQLSRGDTVALAPSGSDASSSRASSYYVTVDGKVLPVQGTTP